MAIPINLSDILEVRFISQLEPQVGLNIRHYICTEVGGDGTTLERAAARFSELFAPDYKALLCNEAKFIGVGIRRLEPLATAEVLNRDEEGVGEGGAVPMSPQTAGLISLRTVLAGRKNRGRLYVPFPSELNNETDGKPTLAYRAGLAVLGARMVTVQTVAEGNPANYAKLNPVIYSRKNGTTVTLSTYLVRRSWATQRRRSFINRPDLLL